MKNANRIANFVHRRVYRHSSKVKYLSSGGLAFGIEYLSFGLLSILGASLLFANTISFCLGLLISFTLNKYWVFPRTKSSSIAKQAKRYMVLALINLSLSNILIVILVENSVAEPVAKIIIMAIIAIWNYMIFSKFIFKSV